MTSYKCVHLVQYKRTLVPENIKVLFVGVWGCSYNVYGLGGFQVQNGTRAGVEFVLLVGAKVVVVFKLFKTPMLFLCPVDSV